MWTQLRVLWAQSPALGASADGQAHHETLQSFMNSHELWLSPPTSLLQLLPSFCLRAFVPVIPNGKPPPHYCELFSQRPSWVIRVRKLSPAPHSSLR